MNVGASKPSDAGLYFQWGDTSGYTADQIGTGDGKKAFSWADYKFNPSGDGKTFTKYTKLGDKLDLKDDAAHVHMGGDWHMPTPDQIEELIRETTTAFTTSDGVSGMTFTAKNGNSIFIPAAGYAWDGSVCNVGNEADVWSCMLNREDGTSEDGTSEEGFGIDGAENLIFSKYFLSSEEVTSFVSFSPGESETPTIDPGAVSGGCPRYYGFSVRGVIG